MATVSVNTLLKTFTKVYNISVAKFGEDGVNFFNNPIPSIW